MYMYMYLPCSFIMHMYCFPFLYQNELQDLLFLVTARYHIAILSFDANTRDIITRGYGDIKVVIMC